MGKGKNLNDLSVPELKALWEAGLIDLEDIPEFQEWKRINLECDPEWVNPYPQPKPKRRM